jgi:membrane dipeptidase
VGIISSAVDRLLNTTAQNVRPEVVPAALEIHRSSPVVDLVVGTALFRETLLGRTGGHIDLPRLRAGGVNVIGLTLATRFPDLRGTLSAFHFRSLGVPGTAMKSNMAIAEWLIGRIERWCAMSGGELRLVRNADDLGACLEPSGPIGVFIGVQGGHVLDGQLSNVDRLHGLGVRMFAPAHVMDNALVGSGTGRRQGGLTDLGREAIAELERAAMLVDLAHMSLAGIDEALTLATRAPALSHTGLLSCSAQTSRWRRYSPATRNVPDWVVRAVGQSGGVVGISLSTQLLGGERIADAVETYQLALRLAGSDGVAIGSDMDGALRMVIDAAGLPLLTAGLLEAGLDARVLSGVLGANALRLLRSALS